MGQDENTPQPHISAEKIITEIENKLDIDSDYQEGEALQFPHRIEDMQQVLFNAFKMGLSMIPDENFQELTSPNGDYARGSVRRVLQSGPDSKRTLEVQFVRTKTAVRDSRTGENTLCTPGWLLTFRSTIEDSDMSGHTVYSIGIGENGEFYLEFSGMRNTATFFERSNDQSFMIAIIEYALNQGWITKEQITNAEEIDYNSIIENQRKLADKVSREIYDIYYLSGEQYRWEQFEAILFVKFVNEFLNLFNNSSSDNSPFKNTFSQN